ncbi:MAG: SAF domain-containing protein [Streptosporangiaceae bacterium]
MSQTSGIDGRQGGRFGAATPGTRSERAPVRDLAAMPESHLAARHRRFVTPWRLAALVVAILVAAGTYALGRYVIAPKPPRDVRLVITTKPLPAGKKLTGQDLGLVTVRRSSAPDGALRAAAAANLIGKVATQRIPAGSLIRSGMLSAGGGMPDSMHALVGLALKPGQLPVGGLAVGQRVKIVFLPVRMQGAPPPPAKRTDATIWELLPPDSSGAVQATVLVNYAVASTLAFYAASGAVSLVATAATQQS